MKVITIKQPWATLIAEGYKEYEFRTWKTKYRGDILIHAGLGVNKKAMEKAAEAIGDDFYILPSSIHETILVPVRGKEDGADKLAEMVACVNHSEVPDTEILSNHVYRYRRQSRRIELVA